jgi:3-hydroxybutyryl-CoA dehydrogenase
LRWIDISGGPELYARAIERVLPTLSNATELPDRIKELARSGARGTANGRGFYQYTDDEAARWDELFLEHAWRVRKLMNEHFPIETP